MSTRVTYVLGNPATGKSTLMRLLDGHPNLAVSPVQEKLIGAFTSYSPDERITEEPNNIFDIRNFRKKLLKTGYHKLEANQIGSHLTGVGASREGAGHKNLDGFDFYDFEREWVTKINEGRHFKPREVLITIFKTMFSRWKSYEFSGDKCENIIGFGGSDKTNFEYLLENISNSNIIVVQRDPRGILATRGKVTKKYNIRDWLSKGKVFDYVEYDSFVADMKPEYENKIHIVNFRDLILNTNEEMKHVVEFLNIPQEETLKDPTFAGERLEEEYIGQINDDWKDILNKYERNVAELQMGEKEKSDVSIKKLMTYTKSKLYYNSHPYLHLGKKGFEKLREMN